MPSLANAAAAMAPEVLGDCGIGVCERTRSEHRRLQLLGRGNVRDGAALLHHHTNTDTRERYAAHWHEVPASS